MPGASLISGLLGSVNASIDEQHKRADAKVHDQRETERAILTHLTSSPDPEISGRALSALAEWSAGAPAPKGGFLNRMITGGETAMHPAVRSVLDLLHTPGEIDVQAGRATAAPAAGGAPAVGPSPGSRGGTPAAGGPVGAPPPAVTPPTGMAGVSFAPRATPQAGSAAQPAAAATQPGGGPASPAAGGSPTGAPPQVAPGMAGVSFLPQTKTATPPPAVNTSPQPSPTGPPPNVAPAGGPAGAPLPVAGQPAGQNFWRATDYRPQDTQRLATQVHDEGIVSGMKAKAEGIRQVAAAQGWTKDQEDAAVRKEFGLAPKMTALAGDVTGNLLGDTAVDLVGMPIPVEQKTLANHYHKVMVDGEERYTRVAAPKATGPEAQAMERAQELIAANPTLSSEDALKQARTEHLQQTRQAALTAYARLQGVELSNQQKQDVLNGTLHAGEALRVAAQLLSQQPNVTLGQVEDLAHQLSNGEGQATSAGKGGAAPAASPQPLETPLTGANTPPEAGGRTVSREQPVGHVYKPGAEAQKALDTINEARPMLADLRGLLAGKENDNSFLSKFNALKQAGTYWAGFAPTDPVYQRLLPLTSLLRVFLTTPYMRGMRNIQYTNQIQQHMPASTDTPALIMEKMANIDSTLSAIEAGAKESGQPTTTTGKAPEAGGPALNEERTINGQLAHWDGKGWLPGAAPKKGGGE